MGFQNLTMKDPIPVAAVDEASKNLDRTEEPIRLLISNGLEICVVDIKQPKRSTRSKVEYLKKIATLNLVEEQLPVSVGLFRLGSDAYMIGGDAFPTNIQTIYGKPNPSMNDKYTHFIEHRGHKGTSSDTYCLSIANNGTLSPSKCNNNILRLQTPEVWPIVAEIKGKQHVFDSFPGGSCDPHKDWIFSHEVISEGKRSSLTIEPPLHRFIKSHLVLGDHIFASAGDMHLLFDPTELKWKWKSKSHDVSYSRKELYFFKNVGDILSSYGEVSSMCVEEIMVGNVSYYLVLSVLIEHGSTVRRGSYDEYEEDDELIVVAFLVSSKGDIVGKQILHSFFRGPVQPLGSAIKGAIIKGGGTDGKTMCIALTGDATINGIKREGSSVYFFSNTFTVELVNNYASNIKHILEGPPRFWIDIDEEVARFHIKDRCVYKIEEEDMGLSFSAGMEACFF